MTRFALPALAFCATAFLAAPSFADDDLCAANLQKIKDTMTTAASTNPSLQKGMEGDINQAKAAQAAGKKEDCIALTGKIITKLDNYTKKGGAAGN